MMWFVLRSVAWPALMELYARYKTRVKWTAVAVTVFVILFAWGYYNETQAEELRLGLGHGATHDNQWRSQSFMLSNRDWYVDASRLGGDTKLPDTWRFAMGYRVDWREQANVAPFLRLGASYFLDEPTPIISERLTFDMAAGLRLFHILDIEWQHQSTAGRSRTNLGNDMIFVGMAFGL